MPKYRIVTIKDGNGKLRYEAQTKPGRWPFWLTYCVPGPFYFGSPPPRRFDAVEDAEEFLAERIREDNSERITVVGRRLFP